MSKVKVMDLAVTIFVRFGSKAVNFFVFILVARSLTGSEMGVYGLVFSTALILSVMFDFGLRNSSAVYVGGEFELAQKSSFLLHVSWVFFSLLGACFLVTLPYFLTSMESIKDYAIPFSILFSGMLYIRIMQGALIGVGYLGEFNKSEISSRVVLIGLTLTFYFYEGITISNALWSLALSQLMASLYLFANLLKRNFLIFYVDVSALKVMLKRGVLFMIAVVIMSLSKRLTFYALGEYSSLDTSGMFFSLLRLSEIVTEVALAVAVVLFSQSVRAKSEEAIIQGLAVTTRHMTAILFVMTVLIFSFSSVFLNILLPSAYEGYESSFDIILWGTFLGSLWVMLFPSLASMVNPLFIAMLFVPSLLFLVVAFYICIELQGGVDVYIGANLYFVTNVITLVMFLSFLWAKYKVAPDQFLMLRVKELLAMKDMVIGRAKRMMK